MQLSPIYDGPPVIDISGVDDPSVPLIRQRERLLTMLASLTDDQWDAQSRCDEWSVKGVVCHLISVDQFWAISFAAGLRGEPTRFLATFDPVASPAQSVDRMRELSAPDVLSQYLANADAFLSVVRGMRADQWRLTAEAPPGHVPLNVTALHALWDCWAHERDIALPLGLAPAEEPDELAAILRYAAALSPALDCAKDTGRTGTLVVEATDPSLTFTVDVGTRVVVRGGDGEGPRLSGRAVDLIEGLSHRAPLPNELAPEDQWLLVGLAEVFDVGD